MTSEANIEGDLEVLRIESPMNFAIMKPATVARINPNANTDKITDTLKTIQILRIKPETPATRTRQIWLVRRKIRPT